MNYRYSIAACFSLLAAASVESQAFACGASPEPANYFTLGEPTPAPDSTGVALDSAILLRGHGWGIGGSPVVNSWFKVDVVRMEDAAGHSVPGRAGPGFNTTEPVVSWVPNEPLTPNTAYRVSASISPQQFDRPSEADGKETVDFTFTTGSERLPTLALTGSLRVELHRETVPIRQCPNCEGACIEVGKRDALVARVTLPVANGGQDVFGYQGWVALTDGVPVTIQDYGAAATSKPYTVSLFQAFSLSAAGARTEEIELPDEDQPYIPCFSMLVWDIRGAKVAATPLCLDAMDPGDVLAEDADAGRGETVLAEGTDAGRGETVIAKGDAGSAIVGTQNDAGASDRAERAPTTSQDAGRGGHETEEPNAPNQQASGCSIGIAGAARPRGWFAIGLAALTVLAGGRARRRWLCGAKLG